MLQFSMNDCDDEKKLETFNADGMVKKIIGNDMNTESSESSESSYTENEENDGLIVENIINAFIALFKLYFKYDNNRSGDKFESDGIKIMIENIRYWVNLREPIYCCLPAFPVKSPSLEKVFSVYPDYGEYLALEQLYKFAADVYKFYSFGCKILIIADGRVYGDLIGVTTENVKIYKEYILNMIKENGFDKHLLYTNLAMELNYDDRNDTDDNNSNGMKLINIFLKQYGRNVGYKEICDKIKADKNLEMTWFGMWKFLEYDNTPWNKDKYKSVKAVQKYCRETAKNMMIRSNAYSNLIREHYPNHIRFSIHGHDNSSKFALCLFKKWNINYCITPWHNTICKMLDGRILLIKNIIVKHIMFLHKQRLNLQIGSKLSIYSRSKQVWYDDAYIDNIEYVKKNIIESEEWLIVKYNDNQNTKRIQRFNDCINPIIGDYQFGEKQQEEQPLHPIDIKHTKQYKKNALKFNEWSKNSTKTFKVITKENQKWYYQEL